MRVPAPELVERVLEMAMAIQQIPAPTFSEAQRATFILERFQAEGLSDVSMDSVGNVYARMPGAGSGRSAHSARSAPPLVVSAHMDTVFPIGTPLNLRREANKVYGPGIGDNATGVAGLFGLLWGLRDGSFGLPGDLWLVGNVGEEGLGNLCGMSAVVDRFRADVRAYLILEGMALGALPVAGDIESIREWITQGKNGLLFDPNDPRAVAAAILSALENGKETVRLNKVLQVVKCLGIELDASIRTWASTGDEA